MAGLNVAKAMAARQDGSVTQQLQQARNEFGKNGFTGTPSFLVGKTGGQPKPLNPSNFGDPSSYTGPIDALLKS